MSQLHGPQLVSNGLVLCFDASTYKSYPGTGSRWYDISGNNSSSFLYGGATGSSDGGILFNGSTGYAQCSFSFSPAMTVTTVAKSLSPNWTNSAGLGSFTNRNGYVLFNNSGSATVKFNLIDNLGSFQLGVTSYTPSGGIQQYNSYTLSTNGSNLHKWYINGVLIDSSTSTFTRGSGPTATNTLAMYDAIAANKTSCSIMHHSVYNRQLTDAEVLQNHNVLKQRWGGA